MGQSQYNGPGSAQLPLIAVISSQQASLAAGAEVFLNVPLPAPLQTPAAETGLPGPMTPVLCSIVATDTANASLVPTANLNGVPGNSFQVRVRNVGTVASGAYFVVALLLGNGGAVGI